MATPSYMAMDKFGGQNFHTWQVKMKFLLMREGLWGIVNGTSTKPATREGDATWQARDDKALALIALGLEDTYIHNIGACHSSNCAWETLEKAYGALGLNSKIGLKVEFYSLEMSINDDLATHLNKMKSIMAQLSSIQEEVKEIDAIAMLLKSMPIEFFTNGEWAA